MMPHSEVGFRSWCVTPRMPGRRPQPHCSRTMSRIQGLLACGRSTCAKRLPGCGPCDPPRWLFAEAAMVDSDRNAFIGYWTRLVGARALKGLTPDFSKTLLLITIYY